MAVTLTFGPVGTDGDEAMTALAANPAVDFDGLLLINRGPADGLFSIDGGANWRLLPRRSARHVVEPISNEAVLIRRQAGGADLSEVYGEAAPGGIALLDADAAAGSNVPSMGGAVVAAAGTPQALSAASAPYKRCAVVAMKPGAAPGSPPSANSGSVYVFTDDKQYAFVLTPGDSVELPPNCDLADWSIDASASGDGAVYALSAAREG